MSTASPESICSKAKRFLRDATGWTTNREIALHLGINIRQVCPSLKPAVADGSVERMQHYDGLRWRLTPTEAAAATFKLDWPPKFSSQLIPMMRNVAVDAQRGASLTAARQRMLNSEDIAERLQALRPMRALSRKADEVRSDRDPA